MAHLIQVSEEVYRALQHQAMRRQESVDHLVDTWLKQQLALENFPDLEWRHGAGGWRVGIRGSTIDVYTVVGFSQIGYDTEEIASELFPNLSVNQIQSALRYYAEYPDEIDLILAENESEMVKAKLYRTLGPDAYERLTGTKEQPELIREAKAKYSSDEPD